MISEYCPKKKRGDIWRNVYAVLGMQECNYALFCMFVFPRLRKIVHKSFFPFSPRCRCLVGLSMLSVLCNCMIVYIIKMFVLCTRVPVWLLKFRKNSGSILLDWGQSLCYNGFCAFMKKVSSILWIKPNALILQFVMVVLLIN